MSGDAIWIPHDQIIARIREDKWRLSTQTPRVDIYRQAGTGKIMNVPKKDFLPELAVRIIL